MYAAGGGRSDIGDPLIAAGAKINAQDKQGLKPLDYANVGKKEYAIQALQKSQIGKMAQTLTREANTPVNTSSLGKKKSFGNKVGELFRR